MPYWRLFYHLVWATKRREPYIGDPEDKIIRRSIALTLQDVDAIAHAVGTMPDHVHVALSIPPKYSVAEVVRRLKGGSSHAVNEVTDQDFAWQREYGVLSFGEKALPAVVAYVADQPTHHAAGRLWSSLENTGAKDRS